MLNFSALADANRAVLLLGHALEAAEFNLDLLAERAEANFITVTELADEIVRRDGLPFSKAHSIVAVCVKDASAAAGVISHDMLQRAAKDVVGVPLSLSDDDLRQSLSAHHFVASREIYGGPAPGETRAALAEQRAAGVADDAWRNGVRERLDVSADLLRDAVATAAAAA